MSKIPYLDHKTKYLNFYVIGMKPKTLIVDVMTKDNYLLGEIKYYARWRGYQYFPTIQSETVLSIGCMTDICDYIKILKSKHISFRQAGINAHKINTLTKESKGNSQ